MDLDDLGDGVFAVRIVKMIIAGETRIYTPKEFASIFLDGQDIMNNAMEEAASI
jgi:hypothetical protein